MTKRVVGQMENGAIMKPPHYSLSALSSIRKINISTIPQETKSQENDPYRERVGISVVYDISGRNFWSTLCGGF